MLVIGAVFVDVKGFPQEKYVATGTNIDKVNIVHGGVCRNVAENFSKLGEPVSFVSMVDSTGAGDAFFSGAVAALSRGYAISQAVSIGTQLAATTLQVEESCCPRAEHLLKNSRPDAPRNVRLA